MIWPCSSESRRAGDQFCGSCGEDANVPRPATTTANRDSVISPAISLVIFLVQTLCFHPVHGGLLVALLRRLHGHGVGGFRLHGGQGKVPLQVFGSARRAGRG